MKFSSLLSPRSSVALLGRTALAALAAVSAAMLLAAPTTAQDNANETAWLNGGCSACHGDVGQGGEPGKMPAGPKLKGTRLSHDQVVEIISCGRPGTGMPTHLAGAYTQTACYGAPLGPAPSDLSRGVQLSAEDIARIADYVKSL